MKEKGFTLIELMVTMGIIGILSSIAVPNYMGMQKKAKIRNLLETSSSAEGELMNFLQSWTMQEDGIADIDGNDVVDSADVAPATITAAVNAFMALNTAEMSPFVPTATVFTTAVPAAGTGRVHITVSGPSQITINAYDDDTTNGNPVYTKIMTVE